MTPDWPSLITTHLRWERDAAVTLSSIAEAIGVPRRVVEQAIQDAVLAGAPVVTGPDGAYLSTSQVELYAAAKALQMRAVNVMRRARALRQTARRHSKYEQLGLAL